MKRLDYRKIKHELKTRLVILRASIVYTFHEDTAYVTENWAASLSTISYTLSFALFVKILYSNLDTLAGYTETEMLLLQFIGQLLFYAQVVVFDGNISRISDFVNSGELDLYLVKPMPILFYLSLKRLSIVTFLRDGAPALFFLGLLIKWNELSITLSNALFATGVFILGAIIIYCMSVLAMLPVFWLGRNDEIYLLHHRLEWLGRREIPFEGFSTNLRAFFSSVIPVLLSVGLSTSVLLGKSSPLPSFAYTLVIAGIFLILKDLLWKKALMAYTSASS